MPDLYTSLLRLKMSMNGGELPPMTDIPLSAQEVIDPTFTIGLGAFSEDAEKGLRCPVRGCGVYRHTMSFHLTTKHADVGGAEGVARLLEIPRSVKLISSKFRATKVAEAARRMADGSLQRHLATIRGMQPDRMKDRTRANATLRTMFKGAGVRNLQNRCEAQMRHALIDLQNTLGRSPCISEASKMIGEGFVGQVIQVYGSWNAAKAQFGLDQYKRGQSKKEVPREAVLEALLAYHNVHGTLPNVNQAQRPNRAPLIPSRPTILKAMGTSLWPEAMRRAASLLNIYGGRYGLPESVRPAKAVA